MAEKRDKLKIVRWIALTVFVVSAGIIVWQLAADYIEKRNYDKIAGEVLVDEGSGEFEVEEITLPETEESEDDGEGTTFYRQKVSISQLGSISSEAIGWISIPSTPVNYPVVQASDNTKYLTLSANGRRNACGAIFAEATNKFSPMDANVVLYGHNMGRGKTAMFSSLLKYQTQSYFNSHQYIQFDTIYGTGIWHIFAAFQMDIGNQTYNYAQRRFLNDVDYNQFIATAKVSSYIQSSAKPQFGDKILTLSTCDRSKYGTDGRFLVMAVLVDGTLK